MRYHRNSNGYPPFCEVQQLNGTIANSARHNRKSEIQDGGRLSGITYNSACRLDSNAISTATPTFSRSSNSLGSLRILSDQTGGGKSKMAANQTGNTYISASRWDRNEIPTAKPTFSRSSNSMGLVQTLSDQTGCGKSNMAATKPEIPISQLPGEI